MFRAERNQDRAESAGDKLAEVGGPFEVLPIAIAGLHDELADGNVQLKDLEAGTQHLVPLDTLAKDLARAAKSHHHG